MASFAAPITERIVTQCSCRYASTYHGEAATREIYTVYTSDKKHGEYGNHRRREILKDGYVGCHNLPDPLKETCESDIINIQKRAAFLNLVEKYEDGYRSHFALKRNLEIQNSEKACVKWLKHIDAGYIHGI